MTATFFAFINCYMTLKRRRSRHKVEGNDQLKQILILGSGLVAPPVVEYLARDKSVAVTVGKY